MFHAKVYGGDALLWDHACPTISCAVKAGLSALRIFPGATFDIIAPSGAVVLEQLYDGTTLNDITTALAGTRWLTTG